MKSLISLFLVLICTVCFGQKVQYGHDAHGNRTQRKLVVQQNNRPGASGDSTSTLPEKTMELAMKYGISIFPNPTQSNVSLVTNQLPQDAKSEAVLFDNLGRVIQKFTNIKSKEEIPMDSYKAGIYCLRGSDAIVKILVND